MSVNTHTEVINRDWFYLEGMVYWYDAKKGYYLKVPEYTHPFITEEMFERDFQKACSITRKKRKNAKH